MLTRFAFAFGALLISTAVAVPAQPAAPTRIWVSGKGADAAGCGTPAQPCRSFQYAHDAISSGGEIDVLDPAGYGPVSITKSISIVNDGVGLAGIQQTAPNSNAVTIGSGSAQVYLRGLTIDGANLGDTGIQVFTGAPANLTVENCVIKNFTGYGIWLDTAQFLIVNSTIINAHIGLLARSNFSGTLRNTTITGNRTGLTAGDTNYPSINFSIINIFASTFFNNSVTGVYSEASTTRLNLFDTGITANGIGLKTNVSAGVTLTRVAITANQGGIDTSNGAQVTSYGDNVLSGNTQRDWNVAPTVSAHN